MSQQIKERQYSDKLVLHVIFIVITNEQIDD